MSSKTALLRALLNPNCMHKYKGRKFDITTLFPPDLLVNGHIPIKKIADVQTALDDWDELMTVLNEALSL